MSSTTPLPPYVGEDPYVFVCYAHANAEEVLPVIRWLKDHGYHVWYDAGIGGGAEWRETVARSVQQCTLFLVFLSEDSAVSIHCLNEIDMAEQNGRAILAVNLQEFELPAGLALTFGRRQAIRRHDVAEGEFHERLLAAVTVDIQYRIRTRPEMTIAFVDLRSFTRLYRDLPDARLEELLIYYDTLCQRIAREYSGELWGIAGDSCSVSFENFAQGIDAVTALATSFDAFAAANGYDTALAIGVYEGTMRSFRQFMFGDDINRAAALCDLASDFHRERMQSVVLVQDTNARLDGKRVSVSDLDQGERSAHVRKYAERHRVISLPL